MVWNGWPFLEKLVQKYRKTKKISRFKFIYFIEIKMMLPVEGVHDLLTFEKSQEYKTEIYVQTLHFFTKMSYFYTSR